MANTEYLERNKKMFEENKKGVSYSQLALRYKMSYNNVARIMQNYKLKAKINK